MGEACGGLRVQGAGCIAPGGSVQLAVGSEIHLTITHRSNIR